MALALLLFASLSFAAPAVVTTGTANDFDGAVTVALSLTVANNGATILIPCTLGADVDVSPTATNYTQDYVTATSSTGVGILRRSNVSSGVHNVTVDVGAGASGAAGNCQMLEVTGIANAGPVAADTSIGFNAGSTTPTTGSTGTLSQASALSIAILGVNPDCNPMGIDAAASGGDSFTNQYTDNSNGEFGTSFDTFVTSDTDALNVSWGTLACSAQWHSVVLLYAASASASNAPRSMYYTNMRKQ